MADNATLSFADLGLQQDLVQVLASSGITAPFPIQAATLPDSLAGRDVLGRGRPGSGKTYPFPLPLVAGLTARGRRAAPRRPRALVLARLAVTPGRPAKRRPRALILAPTRELVTQIQASLAPLAATAGLSTMTVFGGVKHGAQINALGRGVDIVIAGPGRLEDLMRS